MSKRTRSHRKQHKLQDEPPIIVPCPLCTCYNFDTRVPVYDFPRIMNYIKKGVLHDECSEFFKNEHKNTIKIIINNK